MEKIEKCPTWKIKLEMSKSFQDICDTFFKHWNYLLIPEDQSKLFFIPKLLEFELIFQPNINRNFALTRVKIIMAEKFGIGAGPHELKIGI